ncbi:hypothetical protein ZTR_06928 [Talaromyces verruculosus]|nr:hypothetical protein ZTR_06928 [Talaromyces verruculosus]
MIHHLMIGTWTPPGRIYTVAFNDQELTLKLVKKTMIPEDEPISWMTFDHAKKNIYGAAMKKWSSFSVRSPTEIVHEASHEMGGDPMANSADTNTRAIFVLAGHKPPYNVYGNPFYKHAGFGNVFSVTETGKIDKNVQNFEIDPHSGIHGMVFDPTETYLYSADMGANKIWTHKKDPETGLLTLVDSIDAPAPGDHPRWVAIHPSGHYLYALMEAGNRLAVYVIDEKRHVPVFTRMIYPLIPPGLPPRNKYRSDVVFTTKSGKYLFATARSNHNDVHGYISAFRLGPEGNIEKQLFINPTSTSGGHSNAVSPCDWSDEWIALCDDQDGFVEIYRFKDELLARVARCDIPEKGFGMNAICFFRRWAFIIPTITVASWLAMLGALLGSWFTSGQPRYISEEDTQTIAFISDIGAQHLKPVFIACTSIAMITYIISLMFYFYHMSPDRMPLSSRSGSIIRANSLPSIYSVPPPSSLASRYQHQHQQEKKWHQSLVFQIGIPLLSIFFSLVGATNLVLLTIFDTARYTSAHQLLLPTSISAHILGCLILCIWTIICLRQYRSQQQQTKYRGGIYSGDKFTLELYTPQIPISLPSLIIKFVIVGVEFGLVALFAILTWWLKTYDDAAVMEWVVVLMFAGLCPLITTLTDKFQFFDSASSFLPKSYFPCQTLDPVRQHARNRKLLPKCKTDVRRFSLPQTPDELHKLLKKAGLKSIHDLDQSYLGSGSQMTQKQFLALRVVCPSLAPHSKLLKSLDVYGLTKVWNDAVQMVTQSHEYQAYPATPPLRFDHGDPDYPGLFSPVLMAQEQNIRSSDYSQTPKNVPKRGPPE